MGGISAILSLIALTLQLNEVYRNSREQRRTVNELNAAAELAVKVKDCKSALELAQQVLQIKPGDPVARSTQVTAAMLELRRIFLLAHPKTDWEQEVKPLIPFLRGGLRSNDNRTNADILAHIGLAYYISNSSRNDYVSILQEAISMDPDNGYANTFAWDRLLGRGSFST